MNRKWEYIIGSWLLTLGVYTVAALHYHNLRDMMFFYGFFAIGAGLGLLLMPGGGSSRVLRRRRRRVTLTGSQKKGKKGN